jgi:hypothetical protein
MVIYYRRKILLRTLTLQNVRFEIAHIEKIVQEMIGEFREAMLGPARKGK